MSASRPQSQSASQSEGATVLEAIGVTPSEERFYLALLQDPGASVSTICRTLGISTQRGTVIAAALEEKGLLSRPSRRRERMVAAPPDALEPLLLRTQEKLAHTGKSIAALAEEYRATSGKRAAHEIVEVVVGSDAVVRRLEQLQRGAREEIRAFVRPPRSYPDRTNRTEIRLLRKGVRLRALYDREALRTPGCTEEISLYQSEGEQARALETLPMKLVVADRNLAIVPLTTGETPVEPGAIMVHPSALLDALIALFDTLWQAGVPLTALTAADTGESRDSRGTAPAAPAAPAVPAVPAVPALPAVPGLRATLVRPGEPSADPNGDQPGDGGGGLSGEDARILGLLLSGLTDEAVARQLALSVRTVQRRVQRLMAAAHVTTRLQLGWYAHMHGWL